MELSGKELGLDETPERATGVELVDQGPGPADDGEKLGEAEDGGGREGSVGVSDVLEER